MFAQFFLDIVGISVAMVGTISITLPVTSANITNMTPGASIGFYQNVNLGAGYSQLGARVVPNTTTLRLIQSGDNIVAAVLAPADVPVGALISGSVVYLAA